MPKGRSPGHNTFRFEALVADSPSCECCMFDGGSTYKLMSSIQIFASQYDDLRVALIGSVRPQMGDKLQILCRPAGFGRSRHRLCRPAEISYRCNFREDVHLLCRPAGPSSRLRLSRPVGPSTRRRRGQDFYLSRRRVVSWFKHVHSLKRIPREWYPSPWGLGMKRQPVLHLLCRPAGFGRSRHRLCRPAGISYRRRRVQDVYLPIKGARLRSLYPIYFGSSVDGATVYENPSAPFSCVHKHCFNKIWRSMALN